METEARTSSARDRALAHYDERYAQAQVSGADEFASIAMKWFAKYVQPDDVVVDFGCGSGALIHRLRCRRKIGVEINEHVARLARARGIEIVKSLSELPSDSANVIISNHALEHTIDPAQQINECYRVLVAGGTLVLCVPCDSPSWRFREDDNDLHFYSWSANNIGNLLKINAFCVREAKELRHRLPPRWQALRRWMPERAFALLCILTAILDRRRSHVFAVAVKGN